jgi:hypothetical protein
MPLENELTAVCKYCRARTNHITIRVTEKAGHRATVLKCMVCKYEKIAYRRNDGKLYLDQTGVPERTLLLPYDPDYIMTEQVSDSYMDAQKEMDNWLKHSKGTWFGYDGKPRKRRGRWAL